MASELLSQPPEIKDQPLDAIPLRRLDLPFFDGMTALGEAAKKGDTGRLNALIKRGVTINAADLRADTPLIIAARENQSPAVECLLQAGAEVNSTDANSRTALSYALYYGRLEIAEKLIAAGAKADGLDADRRTVLDYARHYIFNKDIAKAEKLAKKAGATDLSARERSIRPMRSDPDFAALEALYQLGYGGLARRVFMSTLLLVGIGWFEAYLVAFPLLYRIVPDLPVLEILIYFFQGSALALFSSYFIGTFVLARPVRVARKDAGRQSASNLTAENWQAALEQSRTDARALSRLLKHGAHRVFNEMRNETGNLQGWLRQVPLLVSVMFGLIPCVGAAVWFILRLGLYLPLVAFGRWRLEDILFIGIADFISLFIATLLVFAAVRWMLKKRLVVKQEYRNERMIAAYKAIELDNPSGATVAKDNHFVLYLRSFAQDNAIKVGNFNFETSLTYVLANHAEVAALGCDSRKLGPVPIAATDEDWLAWVEALAIKAALIVLIPAPTPGVIAEIDMLQSKRLFDKTLFVAPPQGSRSGVDVAKLWEELRAKVNKLEIPPYIPDGFIFTLDDEGQLRTWDTLGLDLEPPPLAAKPTDQLSWHHHDLSFTHHLHHHMAHVAATDAMYHHMSHASFHHHDHSSHHHHHHHRHDS